ncbi:TPA: thiol-activated cytolysin family protein [Elizabethkingia anophelis]
MKLNIVVLLGVFCSILSTSCSNDNLYLENGNSNIHYGKRYIPDVINIISYGTKPSVLNTSNITKSASIKSSLNLLAQNNDENQDFNETREYETSESVVLNHLARYIYPGAILQGNSIQDAKYVPIVAPMNPITVSLSIPSLNQNAPITITNPSLSATRDAVNKYLRDASFTQNGQLSYSIEQFSSYDELKVAFGSNTNTRNLFGRGSSSTSVEEGRIAKQTGYYVKFYQTSFTLDMDTPNGALLVNPNIDTGSIEPVYVSSVAYGRMGILAIETNSNAEEAKKYINESFNKLFYRKETNFSKEEKEFLEGATFNIYLIAGNGATSATSFTGLDAFVKHVSQGTFSKNEPGTPIFCSFSYLKDHSPVKTRFKFDIKKPPLYVELKIENIKEFRSSLGVNQYGKTGNLKLYFYKSRSKQKLIADPRIPIFIKAERIVKGDDIFNIQSPFIDKYSYPKTLEFRNAVDDVFMNISGFYTPYCLFNVDQPNSPPVCTNTIETLLNNNIKFLNTNTNVEYKYSIVPDPRKDYIIIN